MTKRRRTNNTAAAYYPPQSINTADAFIIKSLGRPSQSTAFTGMAGKQARARTQRQTYGTGAGGLPTGGRTLQELATERGNKETQQAIKTLDDAVQKMPDTVQVWDFTEPPQSSKKDDEKPKKQKAKEQMAQKQGKLLNTLLTWKETSNENIYYNLLAKYGQDYYLLAYGGNEQLSTADVKSMIAAHAMVGNKVERKYTFLGESKRKAMRRSLFFRDDDEDQDNEEFRKLLMKHKFRIVNGHMKSGDAMFHLTLYKDRTGLKSAVKSLFRSGLWDSTGVIKIKPYNRENDDNSFKKLKYKPYDLADDREKTLFEGYTQKAQEAFDAT